MMNKEKVLQLIEKELSEMPGFIKDFVNHKLNNEFSVYTIYEYLKNYRLFFEWAQAEGILNGLEIEQLTTLSPYKMNLYKSYLLSRPKHTATDKSQNSALSKATVQRHITALKVLFKFLTTSYDNVIERPYLGENVMLTVDNVKERQTLQARADALEDKLFLGEETHDYLAYIAEEYEESLSPQAKKFYKRDRERDLAINALFLASGLRLSELVRLDLTDISFDKNRAYVTRKGNKKDSVRIASFAMEYLAEYLEIRTSRYRASEETPAFFLGTYKGQGQRLSGNAIEKMVAKYSKAFRVEVSPHKLRHTLATNLFKNSKDLLLTSQQLGHSSAGQTTALYIHIDNDTTMDALNSI